MKEPAQRQASRLVVLDSEQRVLLFRYARKDGDNYWTLPGGGLEKGETFEQAAIREACEELGINATAVKFLWQSRRNFVYMDKPTLQDEHFFQIASKSSDFSSSAVQKVHLQEGILESRWWSVAELKSTNLLIFPEDLVSELSKIVS